MLIYSRSLNAAGLTPAEHTDKRKSLMSDKPSDSKIEDTSKLWGGRFSEATDAFVQRFTASVQFDRRLYQQDIDGSVAHATMLQQVGVLTLDEKNQILEGLEAIRHEIEAGDFIWSVELEDVHMNIESALTARIGSVGKKNYTRDDRATIR